jgi:phosphoglycolate phosphatase-like HAD superfamily hydrolase/GNAT superfamily N-acetyltransferase
MTDVPQLIELWTAAGLKFRPEDVPAELEAVLARDPELVLVAEGASGLVAAVFGAFDGRRGWVNRLATRVDQRGLGLASEVLAELEHQLRLKGCRKVNLLVEPDNQQVTGFYRRNGYAEDELIFMEKWLPPSYILAFDMDGVIFDTESIKLTAFLDAFTPYCGSNNAMLKEIHSYNAAHRGVPRDEKIRFVLTNLLGRSGRSGEGEANDVAVRYAALLAERLPDCQPVNGLMDFLARVDAVRYVVSSAPSSEIQANLERHGLTAAFSEIIGYPRTKTNALQEIIERHRPAPVLYFGDAPADLAAARAAGAVFAAVNPNPGLAALAEEQFDDFTRLDYQCVGQLLRTAGSVMPNP